MAKALDAPVVEDIMDVDSEYVFSGQEPSSDEFHPDSPSSSYDRADEAFDNHRVNYAVASYGIVAPNEFACLMERHDRICSDLSFWFYQYCTRSGARHAVFQQLAKSNRPGDEYVTPHLLHHSRWIDPKAYDVWMATTHEEPWLLLGPEDTTRLPDEGWLYFLLTPTGTKVPLELDYAITVDRKKVAAHTPLYTLTARALDDDVEEDDYDPLPNMPSIWRGFKVGTQKHIGNVESEA